MRGELRNSVRGVADRQNQIVSDRYAHAIMTGKRLVNQ